jgi:hypothetical protein
MLESRDTIAYQPQQRHLLWQQQRRRTHHHQAWQRCLVIHQASLLACCAGIGFCTDTVNLGRLPGWEPHSYGYHGDDGHAFHGSGQGRPFGPDFTTGDVVGALLDRSRKTISYYK